MSFSGLKIRQSTEIMTLAMLRALTKQKALNASVSVGTLIHNSAKLELMIPRRMWAWMWIELPSVPVLTLAYDTRYYKVPYVHLHDWLEDEWPNEVDIDHPGYDDATLPWQGEDRWLDFFERRLAKQVAILREQATALEDKARIVHSVADYLAKR